jgi:hypothetical protein
VPATDWLTRGATNSYVGEIVALSSGVLFATVMTTEPVEFSTTARLFTSKDLGQTWSDVAVPSFAAPTQLTGLSITIDPHDTVFVLGAGQAKGGPAPDHASLCAIASGTTTCTSMPAPPSGSSTVDTITSVGEALFVRAFDLTGANTLYRYY